MSSERERDLQYERDLEYGRAVREFHEAEEAEYEFWLRGLRERGIVLCSFDDVPCNMVFSTVDKLVCKGFFKKGVCAVPTMYVCGRRVSVGDKVVRQKLEVAFRKCSDLCFFDHEKCGSAGLFIGDYPNGCVIKPKVDLNKSLFPSNLWFCARARFENSSVSVGEALVREGGK